MRRLLRLEVVLLAAVSLAACVPPEEGADESIELEPPVVYPVQQWRGTRPGADLRIAGAFDNPPLGGVCSPSIPYNNGPLMTGGAKVYVIWYGNWTGNSAKTILPDLIRSLGSSPRWKVDTTFTNGSGTPVSPSVTLAGQFNDAYSQSAALTQAGLAQVVRHALQVNAFPVDANGIYLVLTSQDVSQTNNDGHFFCGTRVGDYCGWHTWQNYLLAGVFNVPIKYAFIGNGERCPASCISAHIDPNSPNGNRGADGMASVIVHELDETVTDPQITAWFQRLPDGSVCENADNCAWTFGGTWPTPNGSTANTRLGARDFLIQRDWALYGTGFCTTSWPGTCDGTPGQWAGCRGTGCNVCSELVSNAPCYFRNHPNCNSNAGCGGFYFTCNANCPAPAGADFDCHRCGDGTCNPDESAASCPSDCPSVCGDGFCSANESGASCPQDCRTGICGDGVCDFDLGEDCNTCRLDCPLC